MMFLYEVDGGYFVSQMDQEERSGPVEEEGSAEAACWAPLFGQRPEGGERSPRCFILSAHFHTDWLLCCLSSFCMTCYLTLLPPSCLLSCPSLSHLWSLVFLFFWSFFSTSLLHSLLTHSQHVECLFPELQLLLFLDYYWLSQSFKPCLKSVTVDVVCVGSCEALSRNTDLFTCVVFTSLCFLHLSAAEFALIIHVTF